MNTKGRAGRMLGLIAGGALIALGVIPAPARAAVSCNRQLTAKVVALDQALMYNRLGAQNVNGIIYALKRDVIAVNSTGVPTGDPPGTNLLPGLAELRPDKRPRPLVLRMAVGDCLTVEFTNLLGNRNKNASLPPNLAPPFLLDIDDQVADRMAGITAMGVQLVSSNYDDSSYVGQNPNSLAAPGVTKIYKWYADKEGTFVLSSYGATFGGEGQGGNTAGGLWGVLNVEPKNSAFYRSQLNREEMDLARIDFTAQGHPILNYEATYPNTALYQAEGKADLPIINMVHNGEIVHSDINAIIAHDSDKDFKFNGNGRFPPSTYPLESKGKRNPTVPNRLEPFREFTVAFHDEVVTKQAFPKWYEDPVLKHTLHGVRDSFMINYGSGGIGTEIIASRLRVGPMHDCINCAYEEFFLTSFTVGDPAMLVDIPANVGLENCAPNLSGCAATGPKANFALYPDDPSNVHHSYTNDFTKFRNIHAGPGEQHIFHLHNHQWLWNANDDNSNYLDAQGIGPGSGYTYEINFGGSGNRNKTAGDAIFHCHFYPHFAQGMWELWRVHDVFEQGTELDAMGAGRLAFALFDGTPATDARALPDGEIVAGTPIPGVVPLPGKPMAPMPAAGVTVKPNPNTVVQKDPLNPATIIDPFRPTGSLADVPDRTKNPGYPFWIAGIEHTVGQRPPTPPLDMITGPQAAALAATAHVVNGVDLWKHPGFADSQAVDGWDGGLPRYSLDGYSAGSQAATAQTRLDFSKEIKKAKPFFFPEEGTDLEQVAMAYHAEKFHDTFLPDGAEVSKSKPLPDGTEGFRTNGALPVPGAPYNEPCIDDRGELLDGRVGQFFSGESLIGMSVRGSSPHNATDPRVYKAAYVQFDAVFNKLGYHFPQQRIITLWQDVVPTVQKRRPPEPMVFRMNTFDCAQYVVSNVVPKAYELDDYQVRTPTDVIGQHIHLVKWDLTTADGAANGWNYEDGTLSHEMVREVIEAINKFNETAVTRVTTNVEGKPVVSSDGNMLSATNPLHPSDHPFFSDTPFATQWKGARSTMQRWFSDPVVNAEQVDRGLGIIFTHDHFGPSTHQQIGLYATLLSEPAGSKWVHNETGVQLGQSPNGSSPAGRIDGGPTSWQAAILTGSDGFISAYSSQNVGADQVENYREFYFEYSDFQHAYQPGVYVGANGQGFPIAAYDIHNPWTDANLPSVTGVATIQNSFRDAIQPSVRLQAPTTTAGFPVDVWIFPPTCPGNMPRPCPEAISADDPGMYVNNYRNESLAARIYDPNRTDCPDEKPGCQAADRAGDLAFAMMSEVIDALNNPVPRKIPELNQAFPATVPSGYKGDPGGEVFLPPINQVTALAGGDPFTPMPRAYDGDRVHVKVQSGGQEEEHTKILHGLKWLQAGSGFGQPRVGTSFSEAKNSGWRNAQPGGISEQFSFRMPIIADKGERSNASDYAWSTNASLDGWTSGTWGIIRSYRNARQDLFALPSNNPARSIRIANQGEFDGVCPATAPVRTYDLTAVLANDVLPDNANVGNSSGDIVDPFPNAHMGRSPDPQGGTLVYNKRTTTLSNSKGGPLHDPTALLYVHTADLEPIDPNDPGCLEIDPNTGLPEVDPKKPTCRVKLKTGTPVEPVTLRANAGECVNVTLRNKLLVQAIDTDGHLVFDAKGQAVFENKGEPLFVQPLVDANLDGLLDGTPAALPVTFDEMPDLASANAITAMVRRQRDDAAGMTSFNNNLMAPSAHVGLHPALVEFDITRSDGTNVGQNRSFQTAPPGGQASYQWYAGHIAQEPAKGPANFRNIQLVPTPIEFGGFNLMPADKIKQGQKAMVGAGVIYPQGSTWVEDADDPAAARKTRTAATVNGTFRDFTTVWQKGVSMFYSDSHPIENVEGEDSFGVSEDSQDMGHMAINYGTEPLWFRFGKAPNANFDDIGSAHKAYSNSLVGGDPVTPVFTAAAGQPFRMHVLMPFGPGRGSTYDLHGHTWQRDPYTCPGSSHLGLTGKCDVDDAGSEALGDNPIGFGLGGIESVFPGEHYEIVIPSAGGASKVQGDYLFRDHMGVGNVDGLWGIVRVGPAASGSGGGGEPKPCKGKKCK